MFYQIRHPLIAASISLLTICSSFNAFAAPGALAKTPLLVSTAVEPNVFFTLDDSGSMDSEAMLPDTGDFTLDNGVVTFNGHYKDYLHPGWTGYLFADVNDLNIMPPAGYSNSSGNAFIRSFWGMQNHNYNKLYYNPATTYTPWVGVDSFGNPLYVNADPLKVLRDPNTPLGDTVKLTDTFDYYDGMITNSWHSNIAYLPSYYSWIDDNGNGTLELTETHALVEIKPATPSYPSGRTYTDEMQNFANWFQYYRKREFSTKAAIGGVINKTDATRMGLRLINHGHEEDLKTMTNVSNKEALLKSVYNTSSSGSTPLRLALKNTGKMYQGTTGTTAIVPAIDGGECQQNFSVLMTDGFWNGGNPSVSNADNSSTGGEVDTSVTPNRGYDGNAGESNDGGNYEDGYSNTLADVAMYYYEHDLRNDLSDKVPTNPGVDQADHQHMVTYTVSFGVTGDIDPDTFDPLAATFSWPNPNTEKTKIDDLLHAAYNGRGLYLRAQTPVQLENALNKAIADIAARTATAAAASVTSAKLTTESIVYLAEFNTNRWQGTIFAFKIADLDTGVLNITPEWNAAAVLDARDIALNPRTILTYDSVTTKDGIPFQWADLNTAIKDDLRTNAAGGTDSDAIAEARLKYFRGDRSDEGSGNFFRDRATRLGDIVNSGPVYVGMPNLRWPDKFPINDPATPYSSFKDAQKNRDGVVYVGANDGMLHGFDETTGKEIIAYIPGNFYSSAVNEGLHYLTQQNYTHRFYNDLTPSVSDVYIGGSWRTVLISGQRAGGRGYYALDVTDPGSFSEANAASTVLWEFTSDDDADLGFSYSKPQIAMANNGRWVAIFGNGYNHTGASGEAKLFIVDIATKAYKVITTGSGTAANRNGLGTPALADLDDNGTIDRVYAGDLNGAMWAFDLTDSSIASWATAYGAGNPLFTTDGHRPITSKPILSFHPSQPTILPPAADANVPNVMVFFGSGQYLVDNDKSTTHNNYFYGVWDKGTSGLTRADLIEQTYNSLSPRILTQNPVDYSSKFGWNIHLPENGERSVTNPAVRGNIVFFNSSVPTSDACSSGGHGFRFAVDLATGGTPGRPVLDTNNDGKIDSNDTFGVNQDVPSAEELTDLPTDNTFTEKVGYTGADPFVIRALKDPNLGRFSWQELLQ